MLKKDEEKKSMPKSMKRKIMNEKMPCQRSMSKKTYIIKIAHTFKIKGNHQNRESRVQRCTKIFIIRKILKFHTLALLDQSV